MSLYICPRVFRGLKSRSKHELWSGPSETERKQKGKRDQWAHILPLLLGNTHTQHRLDVLISFTLSYWEHMQLTVQAEHVAIQPVSKFVGGGCEFQIPDSSTRTRSFEKKPSGGMGGTNHNPREVPGLTAIMAASLSEMLDFHWLRWFSGHKLWSEIRTIYCRRKLTCDKLCTNLRYVYIYTSKTCLSLLFLEFVDVFGLLVSFVNEHIYIYKKKKKKNKQGVDLSRSLVEFWLWQNFFWSSLDLFTDEQDWDTLCFFTKKDLVISTGIYKDGNKRQMYVRLQEMWEF